MNKHIEGIIFSTKKYEQKAMAALTYKEIEQRLQALQSIDNPDEVGYLILTAFGTSDTYIRRYKSGKGNMAKDGSLLIKKSIAYRTASTIELTNYLEAMKADENIVKQKARILAVSDGKTILAYDPINDESYENSLDKLWLDFQFFYPLAGVEKHVLYEENPADVRAAEKMAKLHNEIRRYNEFSSEADLHELNVFMMRLLFCFFAEDTDIFERGIFTDFIRRFTLDDGSNLSEALDEAFKVMDEKMRVGQSRHFAQFPYVNGGLFHARISIPQLGMRARNIILECGDLDWGEINPDIFGSMMQAVVTPELRAGMGMHYTSVPNIMKVIQPLFLNDLEAAFANAFDNAKKLDALLIRISKMKFFDPACGSGNFLVITYKELRRLEIRIWQRISELTSIRLIPFSNISISQFYGIELDSFGHEIAMLSLWLSEHQMNAEFTRAFTHVKIDALPLKNIDTIIQGNACRLDWNKVCPKTPDDEVFVFGNPPYLGSSMQNKDQKADKDFVLRDLHSYKDLDFIACWFFIGAKYIENSITKCSFVSTSSICEGEQVSMLWEGIYKKNIEIGFAYTPFKWTNNAKSQAAVTCIIIGIQTKNNSKKHIFSNASFRSVNSISPYLTEGSAIIVRKQSSPLSNLQKMTYGNKLTDGGNLILDSFEKEEFVKQHPNFRHLIKDFIGSQEFIQGKKRYCLYITDKDYPLASQIEYLNNKFKKIKEFREKSTEKATRITAKTPYKFFFTSYSNSKTIIIPRVSSERRVYIPMGFLDKNTIVSDSANSISNAPIWLFGVLTSKMHMAWVRTVGGKLKSDYRYSATLCYNTFPFPTITEAKKKEIEALAEEVLLTREHHTEKTLAQMYDPDKMPDDLRQAHHALDLAVDSCYPGAPFSSDEQRLEVLFGMYEKLTKK